MTTFARIDSTAYADDEPLDTYLLRRNHENRNAVREHRGRSATWAPGTLNISTGAVVKPQISGFRERALLPFLWNLSPNTDEIKVAVRHVIATSRAASGDEITLSAFACSLTQFLRTMELPAGVSTGLSGGASSSSTSTLTIDTSGLPAGWIVVCVGVISGEANAVEIVGSLATGPVVYNGFYPGFHICGVDASHTLGTTATVLHHWGLSVREASGGKLSEVIPDRRLLLLEYDTAVGSDYRFRLHVYPPLFAGGAGQSDDNATISVPLQTTAESLWYIELGIIDIDSVTIYESSVINPAVRGRLDANQPAGVSTLGKEVSESHRFWLTTGRMHHTGGSQNPSEYDWTTFEPVNRISASRYLSASYQELCACVVGVDDAFEQSGTNYQRTLTSLKAIVLLTHTTNSPDVAEAFFVDFMLELTDLDGSTSSVTQTMPGVAMEALTCPVWQYAPSTVASDGEGNQAVGLYTPMGYLFGWGPQRTFSSFKTHALRGLLPQGEVGRRSLFELDLSIKDTSAGARRLALSAKVELTTVAGSSVVATVSGRTVSYYPRLHVLTWAVVTTPFNDEPLATTIGV